AYGLSGTDVPAAGGERIGPAAPEEGESVAQGEPGRPRYKRILLKLSGEALAGAQGAGIEPSVLERIAKEIRAVHDLGVHTAIVIVGGNIFRGLQASASGMDRASADYMGKLATVINVLAIQNTMDKP